MHRVLPIVLLGLLISAPAMADFAAPGLWDPLPLDSAVRPPANIGATIAGARAMLNGRNTGGKDRTVTTGTEVQQGCSLQIGSVALPENSSNNTIVLESEVRGSVIQVCR